MKFNKSDDSVSHELLGKVLTGQAADEEFIDHIWRSYDPQTLSGIFARVKSLADAAYKARDYSKAVDHYTSCILLVKNSSERSKLYSNRSISFFRSEQYANAYTDGLKCIALTPKWAKAWFRTGSALIKLEKLESALACLNMSLKYADDESQREGIQSEIRLVEGKIASSRRVRRYQTDYNRFDQLARLITAEEEQQKAVAASSGIEFNDESLSETQKNYLRSQLTGEPLKAQGGKYSAATLNRSSKLCLDWRFRHMKSSSDSKAYLILKEFLLLSSYSSWPARFLSLLDSGISKIFVDKLKMKMNNNKSWSPPGVHSKENSNSLASSSPNRSSFGGGAVDISRVICLGTGSVFCALALISPKIREIVCVTDSAMQIEVLMTMLESLNSQKQPGVRSDGHTQNPDSTESGSSTFSPAKISFISTTQALSKTQTKDSKSLAVSLGLRKPTNSSRNHHHPSVEEDLNFDSIQEPNRNDQNLREQGEKLVLKSIAASNSMSQIPPSLPSSSSVIVIDPDWICPYLLGPNSPVKFLKLWREHSLLLPTRITLNVALANIQRFSSDSSSYYSVLPLPLPTNYSNNCKIVGDFVAAWTLHKFSEIPQGEKSEENIIMIDACKNLTKKDSVKFNALIFSLSFFDGDELFLDTWETYLENSERPGSNLRSLAPYFYWLHEDKNEKSEKLEKSDKNLSSYFVESSNSLPSPPRSSSRASNTISPRNLRLKSHDNFGAASSDLLSSSKPSLRRSFSSSSSSSADLRTNWVAEIRKGMMSSGVRESKRSARSQPSSTRFGENVTHKICLQLIDGCISGANVLTEDGVFTSSENLTVSENLNGLAWAESELLDAKQSAWEVQTWNTKISNAILLTPKLPPQTNPAGSGGSLGSALSPGSQDPDASINNLWVESLSRLRERKCSEICNRQRRIRAMMVGSTAKRLFMRSLVMSISNPDLIYRLILNLIKRGSDHLAENIIDLHCGLDVFCDSSSSLRISRANLKNPTKLSSIKELLMTVKKYKTSLEWKTGNVQNATSSTAGSNAGFSTTATSATSPNNSSPMTEQLSREVSKFLYDDQYLRLSYAVDISQLRPAKDLIDREELLRSLAMLYNCSPQSPGIDSCDGLIEIKQRYDLLIFETPESLCRLTDWVNGSYLRRLIYAKQALAADKTAFFSPGKLILKGFLAYIPSGLEDLGFRSGGGDEHERRAEEGGREEPADLVTSIRSIESFFNFDAVQGARRLSDVTTILEFDLNYPTVRQDLLAERVLTFHVRDGGVTSRAPVGAPLESSFDPGAAPTVNVIGETGLENVTTGKGGEVVAREISEDTTSLEDEEASEFSQAMLHEINLEESNSLLRATSTALDYTNKEDFSPAASWAANRSAKTNPASDVGSTLSTQMKSPPKKYVISSQDNLSARIPNGVEESHISAEALEDGEREFFANALITFSEYELDALKLTHAPRVAGSEAKFFPNPRQRFHKINLQFKSDENIKIRWNLSNQDYEFRVLQRDGHSQNPCASSETASRVEDCLSQINSRQNEMAMNLSHLMGISSEAISRIQEAALSLSISNDVNAPEAINSIIFSTLN